LTPMSSPPEMTAFNRTFGTLCQLVLVELEMHQSQLNKWPKAQEEVAACQKKSRS
jgi:hypothetical protein